MNFLIFHSRYVIEIIFFLLHLLTTPGPPNRLVPDNSWAPRAVPLAFLGVYAVGIIGALVPDRPGDP